MPAVAETVEVRERPILFSGEMVRAILEGQKTQTRRVIKPQPDSIRVSPFVKSGLEDNHGYEVKAKYYPGDRLWVRETFSYVTKAKNEFYDKVRPDGCPVEMYYRADWNYDHDFPANWTPSIFMPRWASRINLEVTSVKVERLQNISEADAIAEGAPVEDFYGEMLVPDPMPQKPSQWYMDLWEKINGKKYPWASNPWVWVVEFKRLEPVQAKESGRC